MDVIVMRGVERKESDGMLARQLTKNVVAANFPTGIGWDQAAGFYPKYFHARGSALLHTSGSRSDRRYIRSNIFAISPFSFVATGALQLIVAAIPAIVIDESNRIGRLREEVPRRPFRRQSESWRIDDHVAGKRNRAETGVESSGRNIQGRAVRRAANVSRGPYWIDACVDDVIGKNKVFHLRR